MTEKKNPHEATPRVPWLLALVAAAVVLAYANSLRGPFVLDDLPSIPGNPTIHGIAGSLFPPQTSTCDGRPVLNLSLALNYAVGGNAVLGYHVVNLAIHLASALLLFGVVREALGRSGDMASAWIAFTASLLWGVHPLTTAAVTYVIQRAESLMALFFVLTLYLSARHARSSGPARKLWAASAVAACLLGMGTKETMAGVPLAVLLFNAAYLSGSVREALRGRRLLYGCLALTWIPLAFLVYATHGRGGTAGFGSGVSSWGYLMTQAGAIAHYLRLCLLPYPLEFYYGGPVCHAFSEAVVPGALVVALALASAWAMGRRPKVGFPAVLFFMALAPSSSFVPVATETIAEHRMYLPLMCAAALASAGLFRLMGRRALLAVLPVALVLGVATFLRNSDYHSALSLWKATVEADPANPWALNNLGCEYDLQPGGKPKAVEAFRAALRVMPTHAEAAYNLANDMADWPSEAEALYRTALRSKPRFPAALNNLGSLLSGRAGREEEAIHALEQAIAQDPTYAEAYLNLGIALEKVPGRAADAEAALRQALRFRPDSAPAHGSLGRVLAAEGSGDEALRELSEGARLDPSSPQAHYDLGTLLRERAGSEALAESELRTALAERPDYTDAMNNLANLLATDPARWEEAVGLYRKSLSLREGSPEEHYNLAVALLMRSGNEAEAAKHLRRFLEFDPGNARAREMLQGIEGRP